MQGLFPFLKKSIFVVIVPNTPEKMKKIISFLDIWKRRQGNIIEVDQSDAEIDPSVEREPSQSLEGIFKGQSK